MQTSIPPNSVRHPTTPSNQTSSNALSESSGCRNALALNGESPLQVEITNCLRIAYEREYLRLGLHDDVFQMQKVQRGWVLDSSMGGLCRMCDAGYQISDGMYRYSSTLMLTEMQGAEQGGMAVGGLGASNLDASNTFLPTLSLSDINYLSHFSSRKLMGLVFVTIHGATVNTASTPTFQTSTELQFSKTNLVLLEQHNHLIQLLRSRTLSLTQQAYVKLVDVTIRHTLIANRLLYRLRFGPDLEEEEAHWSRELTGRIEAGEWKGVLEAEVKVDMDFNMIENRIKKVQESSLERLLEELKRKFWGATLGRGVVGIWNIYLPLSDGQYGRPSHSVGPNVQPSTFLQPTFQSMESTSQTMIPPMEPFTFFDQTIIPQGTFVTIEQLVQSVIFPPNFLNAPPTLSLTEPVVHPEQLHFITHPSEPVDPPVPAKPLPKPNFPNNNLFFTDVEESQIWGLPDIQVGHIDELQDILGIEKNGEPCRKKMKMDEEAARDDEETSGKGWGVMTTAGIEILGLEMGERDKARPEQRGRGKVGQFSLGHGKGGESEKREDKKRKRAAMELNWRKILREYHIADNLLHFSDTEGDDMDEIAELGNEKRFDDDELLDLLDSDDEIDDVLLDLQDSEDEVDDELLDLPDSEDEVEYGYLEGEE
ncbi:hypothetical protein BC829DRAFT_437515 [Chytridium lagenaria]|nr:hypothetical protein BC829DRAFT_437515 [Chytridium lagenaria]